MKSGRRGNLYQLLTSIVEIAAPYDYGRNGSQ
jgi:hypothetical protein